MVRQNRHKSKKDAKLDLKKQQACNRGDRAPSPPPPAGQIGVYTGSDWFSPDERLEIYHSGLHMYYDIIHQSIHFLSSTSKLSIKFRFAIERFR